MIKTDIIWFLAFFLGYAIESVFGFGGGIIVYSIMGFFVDIKEAILVNLFASIFAGIFIIYNTHDAIRFDIIKKIAVKTLIGLAIGMILFKYLDTKLVLLVYSIFLIVISIKALVFKKLHLSNNHSSVLLVTSGIIHGLLGVAGPLFMIILSGDFRDKKEIRSTMAILFLLVNIIRIAFLTIATDLTPTFFISKWFVIVALFTSIALGYSIHKKINDGLFHLLIYIMILLSGIVYFVRSILLMT